MATASTIGYRPGLVDLRTGTISREIFVSEAIYAEELERIFARSWLFVGHESQIPNPGDYVVSRMGEESVILCRDRAASDHYFNVVFFDSYESAMQNSKLPETQRFSQEMMSIADGAPTFYDLDIIDDRS